MAHPGRQRGALNLARRVRLDAAYRQTCYRVYLPNAVADIRIGSVNSDLDRWLSGLGAMTWALVSAYNPRSIAFRPEENLLRHADLLHRAQERGRPIANADAIARSEDWPLERGVLIAGIAHRHALHLAGEFDQYAIVVGRRGSPAKLLWLDAAAQH